MRDFQSTTSVEAVGEMFAVVRVEQWCHRSGPAMAMIVRNKVMVDGPFGSRTHAADALARIDAKRS